MTARTPVVPAYDPPPAPRQSVCPRPPRGSAVRPSPTSSWLISRGTPARARPWIALDRAVSHW